MANTGSRYPSQCQGEMDMAWQSGYQRLAMMRRGAAPQTPRDHDDADLAAFVRAFSPVLSQTVLQWLFPRHHKPTSSDNHDEINDDNDNENDDDEASPLPVSTQLSLLVNGLVRHVSILGDLVALDVLLTSQVFTSNAMSHSQRQHALNEAIYTAKNDETLDVLVVHGADPQAVVAMTARPFRSMPSKSPWHVTVAALENSGAFLVGNRVLLRHRPELCAAPFLHDLLRAGVDPVGVFASAVRHGYARAMCAVVQDAVVVDVDSSLPAQDDDEEEELVHGRETTALMQAVMLWCRELSDQRGSALVIISALLALGADVNARGGPRNETALHCAVEFNSSRIVAWLLERGADPNVCGNRGSPLHRACHRANTGVSAELLKHGADASVRDPWGMTALDTCVGRGITDSMSCERAKMLISYGADYRLRNETTGRSPLDVLQTSARSLAAVELLDFIQGLQRERATGS